MELFKERLGEMFSWIIFIAIIFAIVGGSLYFFSTFFSTVFGVIAVLFMIMVVVMLIYTFINWLVIEPIKSSKGKSKM